ncbi:MAG TPA: MFS transporter [Naasia sp.]|jgi:hypothetical protein
MPLRATPFGLLWVSQALSALGTSISSLAYPLLVLDLIGSGVAAGAVAAVAAATGLVAKLPGGLAADRLRVRELMLAMDAVRAVVIGSLAAAVLAGVATLPLVLAAVAIEVACGSLFGPAEFGLLRLLVPAEERALAVGRMQSRSAAAGLIGPVLGGALYGIAPALPFAADAVSYLASLVCVLLLRGPGRSARGTGAALRDELSAGWRWLRSERFLFAAGIWTACLLAVFGGVGLALLILARDRGAGPAELGVMFAISAAGGLVGALLTPAVQRRWRPRTILRVAAAVDTAVTLALLPIGDPYLIGVAGGVAFLLAPTVSATLFGEVSRLAPDEVVGRAQSTLGLVLGLPAPFAPLLIGGIVDGVAPAGAVIGCAAAFAVLTVAALLLPPSGPGATARAAPLE